MLQQILELISLGKYIVIGIGVIGIIILVAGIYRGERSLITRGGYMLIVSIIIWVCAYFVISTTIDRANSMIENSYMQY